MRKIKEFDNGNESARVYRDSEWDQYIVKFYSRDAGGNWQHLALSDYYTSDKADAINTAILWVNPAD